ncbi:MFS transporter [Thermanaerothrix daxensis]|uniref:MFS transporter n=1 Tax=Thermanaerothrix daxensis TaxID=869279 RepID=A0A0P6XRW6_9CHLR|nr:MFS transporter [Thermanaerothrix daxensis]KPL83171.1 MFS transporter [Thermanaerothrix daxensis]
MIQRLRNSPWSYALGMLALMIPGQAFSSFYTYFYVEKLGLAVGLVTLGRTIYMIWDAINDPIFGYFSDRTRTRIGRRKPWLIATLPLFALFFVLIFSPPPLKGQALFFWFTLALILYETTASIQWVNYGSLFPEIFRGDQQRAKASAIQQGFQIVALLIGTAVAPLLFAALGFAKMALIFAAAYGILMSLCLSLIQEDPQARATSPLGFMDAFRITLSNAEFWVFNIANSFGQTVNGLLSSIIPFYAKYALKIPESQVSALLASIFVSVIPLVAFWAWMIRRFGAKMAWRVAFAVYGLSVLPLALASNLWQGIIAGILVGFGLSGFLVTPGVLNAQIIDRDFLRTGRRREGVYSAVGGFITRASALISAAAFWVVGLTFGYVSGDNPGPNPEGAFRFLTSGVTFGLLVIAFLVSLIFRERPVPGLGSSEPSPTALLPD